MKLCQIWLERERPKLGLKALMRGKQTRISVEEIRRTLWKKGAFHRTVCSVLHVYMKACDPSPSILMVLFFVCCFSFIIPSGKIKYAHVYMKKWI